MPFLADPLNFFYRAIRLSEVASTYGISGNIQTLNLGLRSPLLESSVYPLGVEVPYLSQVYTHFF